MKRKTFIIILAIAVFLAIGIGWGLVKGCGQSTRDVNTFQSSDSSSPSADDSFMEELIKEANTNFQKIVDKRPMESVHVMISFQDDQELRKIIDSLPINSRITGVRTSYLENGELYSFGYSIKSNEVVTPDSYAFWFLFTAEKSKSEIGFRKDITLDDFREDPIISGLQVIAPAGKLQSWLKNTASAIVVELLPLDYHGLWAELGD